ncbi:hypothetical protein ACIGNX_21800 [Actinosynnema sp. NPDC053489]|uniref:hypothetical protein n=1 Tax=Actinosynnema sp. NPDC053489 TaxID=3363916 RepID=UPI0037C8EB7E
MSDDRIHPLNLSAQLHHQAAGNPPSTLPESAISNAFPGLEFDFRNIWRFLLDGIELHESDNYVVAATDPRYDDLVGHRLLTVGGCRVVGHLVGPTRPGAGSAPLTSPTNPDGVTMLEWSNALADVLAGHADRTVDCVFTDHPAPTPVGPPPDPPDEHYRTVPLRVRPLFATSPVTGDQLAVIAEDLAGPGDLTRGLCSPWQNDYRECACYYWAASRPDYVNVEDTGSGTSTGDHWFAVHREPREYVLDDREDSRLVSYDDLFQDWQGKLRFVVGGNDAPEHLETEIGDDDR